MDKYDYSAYEEYERYEKVKAILLRAGMEYFVNNYYNLKSNPMFLRGENVTAERFSSARALFIKGYNVEALKIVSESRSRAAELAKYIYRYEIGEI